MNLQFVLQHYGLILPLADIINLYIIDYASLPNILILYWWLYWLEQFTFKCLEYLNLHLLVLEVPWKVWPEFWFLFSRQVSELLILVCIWLSLDQWSALNFAANFCPSKHTNGSFFVDLLQDSTWRLYEADCGGSTTEQRPPINKQDPFSTTTSTFAITLTSVLLLLIPVLWLLLIIVQLGHHILSRGVLFVGLATYTMLR